MRFPLLVVMMMMMMMMVMVMVMVIWYIGLWHAAQARHFMSCPTRMGVGVTEVTAEERGREVLCVCVCCCTS